MVSQKIFNTNIVYYILIFLTDIYTPSYDQRFLSYAFWKLTRSLKFGSERIQVF
jgi:hypothetical protein